MKTRRHSRMDSVTPSNSKPTVKAALSEVLHDLQLMTDESPKHLPRPQQPHFEDSKRFCPQPLQSPAHADTVSAVLGFASFISEIETLKKVESLLPKERPRESPRSQSAQPSKFLIEFSGNLNIRFHNESSLELFCPSRETTDWQRSFNQLDMARFTQRMKLLPI